jgi:hypothetical protein
MHYVKAVEGYGGVGAFFRKTQAYRPKIAEEEDGIYLNTLYEQVVRVRKIHIQHWAVRDLKRIFKVNSAHKWDPHPINITKIAAVYHNYSTIADSDRGPVIAEHDHTLALQFTLGPRYPESIAILHNFISKMSEDIKAINAPSALFIVV